MNAKGLATKPDIRKRIDLIFQPDQYALTIWVDVLLTAWTTDIDTTVSLSVWNVAQFTRIEIGYALGIIEWFLRKYPDAELSEDTKHMLVAWDVEPAKLQAAAAKRFFLIKLREREEGGVEVLVKRRDNVTWKRVEGCSAVLDTVDIKHPTDDDKRLMRDAIADLQKRTPSVGLSRTLILFLARNRIEIETGGVT